MTPATTNDPWRDQFTTPSAASLLDAIPEDQGRGARSLFDRLGAGGELVVRWCGVPWRWVIEAAGAGPSDPHLVPDPEGPYASLGLLASEVEALDLKRLRRATRDALATGKTVRDRLWVELPLDGEDAAADFMRLASPGELTGGGSRPKRTRRTSKPKS